MMVEMAKKKIVLLNPPGSRIYIRDYYCSKISKASYYNQPVDFLFLSALLCDDFDVCVLDCIAEKLNDAQAMKRLRELQPQVVIFLSGAVSYEEDMAFLRKAKDITGALMIASGDLFLDHPRAIMQQNPFIDAILLDFSTKDILSFLKKQDGAYKNIFYRQGSDIVDTGVFREEGVFDIGMPRHSLFKNNIYVFPFSKSKTFATVLTDFGCPHSCVYCPAGTLGYKSRDPDSIIEELSCLKKSGIREIFFKDQNFGYPARRAEYLYKRMAEEKLGLSWSCFARIELMDESTLSKMRDAGCHTIIFGVESADERMLAGYKRAIDIGKAREVFSLCRRTGIESVATFIIGFPDDTRKSVEKTIEFSLDCGCDYASFNIFTPAYATAIRKELVKSRMMEDGIMFMDCGISLPAIGTKELSRQEVHSLRNKAVARFYLSPKRILRLVFRRRGFFEYRNMLRQFTAILRSVC